MTRQVDKRRMQWKSAHKLQLFLVLTLLLACGWGPPPATAQSSGTTTSTGPLLKIYFTDGRITDAPVNSVTVESVNADGTGLTTLVPAAGYRPRGIVLDDVNGHLYWNDFGEENDPDLNPGRTLRSDVDGSNVVTLLDHEQAGVNDIDLDIAAGHVYMALSGFPFRGVRRVNFDGTGLVDLIRTFPFPESPPGTFPSVFIDGLTTDPVTGDLYYGDAGDELNQVSEIVRTNLDGTGAVSLVLEQQVGLGRGLAVDLVGGKMYFAQHDFAPDSSGNIYRANLDGTALEVIVAGLQRPRDVALDLFAGRIYWADEQARRIQSANLDGTDMQDVVTGLDGPSSLTLQAERCVPVENPDVRTQGFWKRVCAKPHPSGEHEKLPGYVDCVNTTTTFADVNSVEALCDRLNPKPKNDKCKQAEAQFMALLLNVCSGRVATCNSVFDPELGDTTVGEVIDLIDDLLSSADRSRADCVLAQSVADLINNGITLVPSR